MSVEDLRKAEGIRRVLESTVATLTGGLILWWMTAPVSQSAPLPQSVLLAQPVPLAQSSLCSAETPGDKTPLSVPATAAQSCSLAARSETAVAAAPSTPSDLLTRASPTGPATPVLLPTATVRPHVVALGAVLFYEDFSHYQEGQATEWGVDASVRTGLDRRKWLVPTSAGTHPLGRSLRLPTEFYLEFRYSVGMSNVTRGVLGMGREPVSTKISLLTDRGIRHEIEWVIGCGNDITRLNPLGSSSLCARKYYHTVKLPDGTAGQAEALQPTGVLRINRDNGSVQVLLGGQPIAAGAIAQTAQLVGFEINAVMSKNGTLSFTEFKIAR